MVRDKIILYIESVLLYTFTSKYPSQLPFKMILAGITGHTLLALNDDIKPRHEYNAK